MLSALTIEWNFYSLTYARLLKSHVEELVTAFGIYTTTTAGKLQ